MLYREESPPAELARWVECAWSLDSEQAVAGHRVPPDGCVDIVYDRVHGLRAIGTMTVEQRFDFAGPAQVAGVRFRPGMAARFLRIPSSELTDASTPLEDLWSSRARELERKMDDAASIRDAMGILTGSLPSPGAAPDAVERAIEAVTQASGDAELDSIADQANLSPRQFRRRCLELTGLTPKRLCRVLRFRRACEMATRAARPDWTAIALDAGYFDQAHLIRDFHEFTGVAPMAVFSNTLRTSAR